MEPKAIRLPEELARAVERIASEREVTQSDVVREAVERYCAAYDAGHRGGRVAPLDRLVTYPGSGLRDLGSRSEEHLRRIFNERRQRSR